MRRWLFLSRTSWAFLVFGALWGMGCESSRTLQVLDGEPSGIGGATLEDPSTGGAPDDPPPATGGAMLRVTPDYVIDDFYDCNGIIISAAGRSGYWYHFAEPAVNNFKVDFNYGYPPPGYDWAMPPGCGIYFTGNCDDCTSAGVGFELADEPWDLSGYKGIRIWVESDVSLWAVIVSADVTGEQDGYSEYVELLPTGGLRAERILSFDDIYPGTDFLGLPAAREVQFTVGEGDRGSFHFGIRRVELVE